jgi:Ca2+-binding RTX toxin-like protein
VRDATLLGATVADGRIPLGQAFFNPDLITHYGIEPYLKGLATQQIQEIDNFIVDGVRNLLFDPPAAVDLGATNLQRGRDHGLPDYNQAREDYGLPRMTVDDFDTAFINSTITDDDGDPLANDAGAKLSLAYNGDIDNIDVFSGAIAEPHVPGGSLGELIHTVLADQFTRLRDGDRFYFENVLRGKLLRDVQNTRLSDIIRRNTGLQNIQDEVFRSEEVLTFRAEEGRSGARVEVRVAGDDVQVVRGRRVLASQPIEDTKIVVLFGTSRNDVIKIDDSASAALDAAGISIELHGGGGRNDRLVVQGTRTDDVIVVNPTEIRVNDLSVYYGNFERIEVQGRAGDDDMSVVGDVAGYVSLSGDGGDDMLFGGAGNGVLSGGSGSDILVGGAGNEALYGGSGRDLMIGGGGSDLLLGQNHDDLLIAAATVHDNDRAALQSIRATWTSADRYTDRVDALRGSLLGPAATLEDNARDLLFGSGGQDWFLFDVDEDWVVGRNRREAVN